MFIILNLYAMKIYFTMNVMKLIRHQKHCVEKHRTP
jgi:hypothetical protein